MSDLINIGFKVATDQIEKGYNRLNKMGQVAEKTEGRLAKTAKSATAVSATVASIGVATLTASAAISAFLYKLASAERELQASARMAGLTTDQFEEMAFAYKQFGLTVEQVNDIYKDSIERVGEWRSAQSGALQDFGDVMGWSKDRITEFANEVDGLTGQQLLQRMVNDMNAAGASASDMSFALEGMASEATRMIPALDNNGKAIQELTDEYREFNSAFSLDPDDVEAYATLAKNFDLFLSTAENGMTKVLAPLADYMADIALNATHFYSALEEGTQANLTSRLADISEEIENYTSAIKDNESVSGRLKNSLFGFTDDTSTDSDMLSKKIEELKEEREKIQEQLSELRFGTTGLIDTSKPLEIKITTGVTERKTSTPKVTNQSFGDMFGGSESVDLFALNQAKAYDQWIESISTTSTQIADLRSEIEKTQQAVANGDLTGSTGEEYIADLESQIKSLEVNPFESMTQGASDALSAMSGMFESGSKDAKKLAIAMEALNLVQAVGAVLNQGNGDPYTAFGRMAAMAAAVASLGVSVGNMSGGLSDDSEQNQANQGLNVWGEKSEAILEATEVTAGATEKLVGINTNMLKAMQGLTIALSSAAGMIVRDTDIPNVSVNVKDNIFDGLQDFFSGDLLNLTGILGDTFTSLLNLPLNIIGSWLGGSSSVADEGIRILGGTFNELMDDVTVQAFQTVKYKKWKFGSTKTKTSIVDAGDEVGAQFALVFESIANSVSTGAIALGLSASEIEKSINDFEIATTTISLKGLSAEDQKAEIEAVFSQIFSDLAGEVVPFAEDFQQVGEDLGTTLARLASQVAVTEEITARFGINFGDKFANPEAYAQAADNLASLAGGVEELAEKTSSFTNAFATDSQKFDIYQRAMNDALNEVGLTLPSTAEGLYDLMMSLDGTTEAGQEQIATLLGLTDTASEYFSLLDKTAGAYREAAEGLFDITEASRAMSLESALAAARLGDFSLAEQLELGSIAPSTGDFSSAFEYNLARAETAAKLNELADLQSGQVTVEDKQLTVLEQIRDKLGDSDTMNDEVKKELMELRVQMNKQQTESNDYLRRLAYQGA